MKAIFKASVPEGIFRVPSSKSEIHRLLIIAAFHTGIHEVFCDNFCDDVMATVGCLNSLGIKTEITDHVVKVYGIRVSDIKEFSVCDCRESASTLRFLLPVVLFSCKDVSFTGSGRLFDRVLYDVKLFISSFGCSYGFDGKFLSVRGELKNGNFSTTAKDSSQLVSGLLLALSLTDGKSRLYIDGNTVSGPYIDLTVGLISKTCSEITRTGNCFCINGYSELFKNIPVPEQDYSGAAFFYLLSVFGDVRPYKPNIHSLQGDSVFPDLLERMKIGNISVDITDIPDLAPPLFVAASMLNGACFKGIKRLINKESNRLASMLLGFDAFDIKYEIKNDELIVFNSEPHAPCIAIDSCDDHRIAMAFSCLLSFTGGILEKAECVSKSMPTFFEILRELNIGVDLSYEP